MLPRLSRSLSSPALPTRVCTQFQDNKRPAERSRSRILAESYEDFTTIDWLRDGQQSAEESEMQSSNWMQALWQVSHGWVLMACIGLVIGVSAGALETVTAWLSDLKGGVCRIQGTTDGWYLNRKFCCWEQYAHGCQDWHHWSTAAFGNRIVVLDFLVYTLIAVSMSSCSFLLVKRFAPYAASSGLPEIKTILGGFVIRGFLGLKTAAVKLLAVALSVASGMSVGKEATLVHISCCLGNVLTSFSHRYNNNQVRKRQVMSATAAAGIAVAVCLNYY